jgi:RNA polymerase-binding transcription factor DksA
MATPEPTDLRAQLQAERDDLLHRISELTADGSAAPEFDEGFADSAQVTAEQVENRTLAASLQIDLTDVEGALARLDDGTYGTCTVCGAQIAPARLEAMPATPYCIDHA